MIANVYTQPEDIVDRYDERTVRELLSDDGSPAPTLDNSKMIAAIRYAGGEIDAAVMVGGQYTTSQLQGLADGEPGHAQSFLMGLASDLTLVHLLERRLMFNDLWQKLNDKTKATLEALRLGKMVFGIIDVLGANVPKVDGIREDRLKSNNTIITRARRFYPSAGTRLPEGRSS